ncbi:hypothetical protein D623_10033363 [Myotis brandtii]|uniref:Uncharacterized protein n=1 Tax=Myotis brandtii TaxID=109478 RepID=S7PEP1_MYOBR|nr:hypothetical protein D623_10033363 [Myotis brandtii]
MQNCARLGTPPPSHPLHLGTTPSPGVPSCMAGTPQDGPKSRSATLMPHLRAMQSGHWDPPPRRTCRAEETLAEAARSGPWDPRPTQGCRNPGRSPVERLPPPPPLCAHPSCDGVTV